MSPDSVWIPSLGVSVTVLSEGQSGGLASIPVGKTRVGWLNWTPSLTSRAGTTVIAGHVTYDNIPGAFYKLPQIKAGAVVYMARRQAGEGRRRHDTREQVVLYLTAFKAWASEEPVSRLRYNAGEPVPVIPKI